MAYFAQNQWKLHIYQSRCIVHPGSLIKGKRFKNPTLDGVSVAKTDILVIMDSGEKEGWTATSKIALMDNIMKANTLQRSQEEHYSCELARGIIIAKGISRGQTS